MEPHLLASLIERAKGRDPGAFDALVDAYGSRLYGYLYRLTGVREEAEDLLQELFVRLVRTLPQYEHDGKFEEWVFCIATNLARDRLRRARRAPATFSLDADEADATGRHQASFQELADLSGPSPDMPLELREDVDALQRALGRASRLAVLGTYERLRARRSVRAWLVAAAPPRPAAPVVRPPALASGKRETVMPNWLRGLQYCDRSAWRARRRSNSHERGHCTDGSRRLRAGLTVHGDLGR